MTYNYLTKQDLESEIDEVIEAIDSNQEVNHLMFDGKIGNFEIKRDLDEFESASYLKGLFRLYETSFGELSVPHQLKKDQHQATLNTSRTLYGNNARRVLCLPQEYDLEGKD